jgi:hypothetical protein
MVVLIVFVAGERMDSVNAHRFFGLTAAERVSALKR